VTDYKKDIQNRTQTKNKRGEWQNRTRDK